MINLNKKNRNPQACRVAYRPDYECKDKGKKRACNWFRNSVLRLSLNISDILYLSLNLFSENILNKKSGRHLTTLSNVYRH